MQFKISLVVDGLDLDNDDNIEIIADNLSDLVWSENSGRVLATLFCGDNPIMNSAKAADRIRLAFPASCVQRVDRGLVGLREIADRAHVTAESVRLWSKGQRGPGNFPAPVGSVGGGQRNPMKLWFWPDVNSWLDNHYRLGDGYRYVSDRQVAEILERITAPGYEIRVPTNFATSYNLKFSDRGRVGAQTVWSWTSRSVNLVPHD